MSNTISLTDDVSIRRVSLVEKEMLSLVEHLKSTSVVCEVVAAQSLVLCRSLFLLFLLAIVLSVLLRLMASNFHFRVFKLFSDKTNADIMYSNLITHSYMSHLYGLLRRSAGFVRCLSINLQCNVKVSRSFKSHDIL